MRQVLLITEGLVFLRLLNIKTRIVNRDFSIEFLAGAPKKQENASDEVKMPDGMREYCAKKSERKIRRHSKKGK